MPDTPTTANAVRTPSPGASGIGRRVQPGRLDVGALIRSGALTAQARDGTACGGPVTVTHLDTATAASRRLARP